MINKHVLLLLVSSLFSATIFGQNAAPKLGKDSVQRVINALTIKEKSLLVTGAKRRNVTPVPLPGRKMKNINAVGGYTYPFVELGIPSMMVSDGPAGLRIAPKRPNDTASYYCTAFPVASLVASSWDVKLAERIGKAMGNEAKEYGVDLLLGPALNIHRDPLGGRSFEYYSEDPLISGKMAAAVSNGIQSQNIGACLKHFVANEQETSRQKIDVVISERALREIYLEGFRIAVKESKPWSVMSSYNKVNGAYTSQRYDLLTDVLRKEWGFDGFVITDWYAGDNAVEQLKAGNDLLMPGLAVWSDKVDSALRAGTLDTKVINKNIERILTRVMKTGTYKNTPYSNTPDFKNNEALARSAAAESMVLLKNTASALPLQPRSKIAVYGNYAYKNIPGGTGSGSVNNRYNISIVQGVENAGFSILDDRKSQYLQYLKKGKPANLKADSLITGLVKQDSILGELTFKKQTIDDDASAADVAVVTIMRVFGEGGDRNKQDFFLTKDENDLLKTVSASFHAKNKRVVVVLNVGGVIETESWRNNADAILLTWLSGQEGGNAVADLLSGKVTPSGKLITTFPVKYEDAPSSKNFPGTPVAKPEKVIYQEGIYIGYRYFDSFGVKPAYPFGFGLSYTNFRYSGLQVNRNSSSGHITASFTITNTGKKTGREVAQLYISAPGKTLDKPKKELKGFAKTKILLPGKSEKVVISLTDRSLSSFDTRKTSWVTEAGKYQVLIASSSEKIELSKPLTINKAIITEKVNKALVPTERFEELSRR